MNRGKAIFLDRDGTINVDKGYVYKPEDMEFIDGAPEAIRHMNELGYKVIVISNQSGIARGFYTSEDVLRLHQYMDTELAKYGARVDAYYFCPHHPDYGPPCECRKPKTGLVERAIMDFDIDAGKSWMVGDKASDAECAKNAAMRAALVQTGNMNRDLVNNANMIVIKDLYQLTTYFPQDSEI